MRWQGETIRVKKSNNFQKFCTITNCPSCAPQSKSGDTELIDNIFRTRKPSAICFHQYVINRLFYGPDVLSVACGHMREAELVDEQLANCKATTSKGWLLGIDQDPVSVAEANACYSTVGAIAKEMSVSGMLRAGATLGSFDFIYSLGLYDYLQDPQARLVTRHLATLLKPGGKLIIANFMPSCPEAAYMEAFMDWWLIYRDEAAMDRLCKGAIPSNEYSYEITVPIPHITIATIQH